MSYDKERFCSQACEDDFKLIGGTCDFCYYYNFNGDEIGAYTGDGYCTHYHEDREPHDGCDEFICAIAKPRNEGVE